MKETINMIKTHPFPLNLMLSTFSDYKPEKMPSDIELALAYFLSANIKEEYHKILYMRYRNLMTYEEIAEATGRTRERVRQLLVKIHRKMRHPRNSSLFELGLQQYVEHICETSRETAFDDGYRKGYKTGYRDGYNAGLKVAKPDSKMTFERATKMEKIRIEDCDLSTRSYNGLKSSGFENMMQVSRLSKQQLKNLQNIGEKSANEILAKIAELISKYS